TGTLKLDTSAFDFSDMTLDESAFADMDLSSMDLSGVDLSGLDLSGLDFSGVDMSGLDLSEILKHVKFNASSEQLSALTQQLLAGYQDYAKEHPEADFSRLGDDFLAYLETLEARETMTQALE